MLARQYTASRLNIYLLTDTVYTFIAFYYTTNINFAFQKSNHFHVHKILRGVRLSEAQ